MKAVAWLAGFVCSFCIILTLLYCAIIIPAFDLDFYAAEYDKYSIAESLKMEKNDLLSVTSHMLDYIKDKNNDLNVVTRVDGTERFFFNQKEIDHMADVKVLFEIGKIIRNIGIFAVMLFIVAVFIKRDAALRLQAKANLISIAVLALLLAALGLFIYLDFNRAFNIFHELFFSNDLWQLNPETDLLINLVPLEFFIDITKEIAIVFSLFLAAVAGLSFLFLFRSGKSRLRNFGKIGR